ncbi:MAG: hypothetical protein JXQ76_11165 [Campylobacterales bacterium]|nr:hypothetical protein [Campylobacterales bacterium]
MLKYMALFFILSIIYIVMFFYMDIWGMNNIFALIISIFALLAYITPWLGRKILIDSSESNQFFLSYIILILVILPTSGDFAATVRYPYFIFDWQGIEYFQHSKNGVFQSYMLAPFLITSIVIIIVFKWLDNQKQ